MHTTVIISQKLIFMNILLKDGEDPAMASRAIQVKVNLCKMLFVGNGILTHALMEKTVNAGMHVGIVQKQVSWESHTRLHRMKTLVSRLSQASSAGSRTSASDLSAYSQGTK